MNPQDNNSKKGRKHLKIIHGDKKEKKEQKEELPAWKRIQQRAAKDDFSLEEAQKDLIEIRKEQKKMKNFKKND